MVEDFAGEDRRSHERPEAWHIKREVQLGHIITTITVAVGMVMYFGKIE